MAKPILPNIKLPSIDELFTPNDVLLPTSEGQIMQVKLSELHPFPNHPFQVRDDEKMQETIESIRNKGVLVPIIIRSRKEGGYELISGHRRTFACKALGMDTIPALLREMDDDEATIVMVDANIQREKLLPSEKAKAYAMKYEAIKHQGRNGGNSLEEMARKSLETPKTIQRYIWLSRLTDSMMELMDSGKIGPTQGISLSFLPPEEQEMVSHRMIATGEGISVAQAEKFKEESKLYALSENRVAEILQKEKTMTRKVTLSDRILNQFFSENVTTEQIESILMGLLSQWKEEHCGNRADT